ncbi:MAG: FAD-binding oxidoreductase [Actinomycetota bacterium]|nr:FAD-binding oxidoreductase [Actinomycetota bacterium]
MARILVAGAGAIGASIAYHLAELGADDVVLTDRAEVAAGATGKAMGGVRQQFATAEEVRLAQASVRFFEELGPPFFEQVGYVFLAVTEAAFAELEARMELQRSLGVAVERVAVPEGVRADDVVGAVGCRQDGVGDPVAVTGELVRRAVERGVEVRERTAVEELRGDEIVIACGPWSAEAGRRHGVELPVRPLCRQLLETGPIEGLPQALPMTIEAETGFHFRRRGDRLVLAMADAEPRWGFEEAVDASVFDDRLARLAHRFPAAAQARVDRAWAGLYDMTPDAHPIIGRVASGVFAACGFSGHGFMQSPAVGRALAEEILGLEPSFDLAPYRLERYENGAVFPEQVIL